MSLECSECERDLRGGHDEDCPRHENNRPVPIRINCPDCGELHVDEGKWVTKLHHTHACQECGLVWRPANVNTVGVKFLPGFKDE